MTKTVEPTILGVGSTTVEIKYEKGRLSIRGVGGFWGQCYEEIASGSPADGWTREMLDKFAEIWKKWHLNDMRPYCKHQKELGWDNEATQKVTVYYYRLTDEARRKQKRAEEAALEALRMGEPFVPSKEQTMYAALPYIIKSFGKELVSAHYQPGGLFYSGNKTMTETKTRGQINYDENPIGILGRPCPICGYKYGTSWIKEEVPQDVIDWLFSLPSSTVEPAWI